MLSPHLEWAIDFLEDELANDAVQAAEIHKRAREAGVSKKSLRRAQDKLGIRPKKVGFNEGWVWSLPNHEESQEYEDAPPQNEGILGTEGNLRIQFHMRTV